jgi:Xaa-Pro aminopeptidase
MTRPDLPPIAYDGRSDALRARLDEAGVPALLLTDPVSVRWLTGFTGSNGAVAVLPGRMVLVTDPRYRDRAAEEIDDAGSGADVVIAATPPDQQTAIVTAFDGIAIVGAEAGSIPHARWEQLAGMLPLVAADGHVADLRRVKDRGEVARIELACRCADAALAVVAPALADGLTESDVRDELEYLMRRHGADGPSYPTIVASGPEHAARPHHDTGQRRIVEGDTVVIDVGALVDGYHSDMTRSFVIGDPSAEQQERYDFLLEVQRAGLAAVRAGTPARDVDAACREPVLAAGYGDWFLHGTGHGVGLLIHEDPFESPIAVNTLRAGDVVTVEPGLYRVGFGGYRIEDLVEVTDDGCRVLTAFPKESPCLPSPPTT